MATCLFCLEEFTSERPVLSLNSIKELDIPCKCRIDTHPDCWMVYYIRKGEFECPICHCKFTTVRREEQVTQNITIHTTNQIYSVMVPAGSEQDVQINLPPAHERVLLLSARRGLAVVSFIILGIGLIILFTSRAA
jgi:hypothetical protein